MTIFYSCLQCGLDNVAVTIPAREEEDVVEWMEKVVIISLAKDHYAKSPYCTAKALSEVKIPITGVDKIGGEAIQ